MSPQRETNPENGAKTAPEQASEEKLPARQSVFDRAGQVPTAVAMPSDLTGTFTVPALATGTFRVDDSGVVENFDTSIGINPVGTVIEQEELDLADVQNCHVLVVGDDVETAEIEALAISLWEESGWLSPGVLTLKPDVTLSGPWNIPESVSYTWKLPRTATVGWVLHCPIERGDPVPEELHGTAPLEESFIFGSPIGTEFEVLSGLARMARRLNGVLRLAGTGKCYIPDPDSAVALNIISTNWVQPQALIQALAQVMPGIKQDEAAPIGLPATYKPAPTVYTPDPQAVENAVNLGEELGIDRSKLEWLHAEAAAYDAAVLGQNAAGQGPLEENEEDKYHYVLYGRAGKSSEIEIVVSLTEVLPKVLRWENFPEGRAISYEITWAPRDNAQAYSDKISRTMRLERLRVSRDVESVTAVVNSLVAGRILDEDGFLVEL